MIIQGIFGRKMERHGGGRPKLSRRGKKPVRVDKKKELEKSLREAVYKLTNVNGTLDNNQKAYVEQVIVNTKNKALAAMYKRHVARIEEKEKRISIRKHFKQLYGSFFFDQPFHPTKTEYESFDVDELSAWLEFEKVRRIKLLLEYNSTLPVDYQVKGLASYGENVGESCSYCSKESFIDNGTEVSWD